VTSSDETAASQATEAHDADAEHVADRPPTAEEERRAEEQTLDPDVAEHEREMAGLGAEVKGEGEIE
jgi:hypothetical protein